MDRSLTLRARLVLALLGVVVTLVGATAASAAPRWRACGSYTDAAQHVAVASYSAKGITCKRALTIILRARKRSATRPKVLGFRCVKTYGEAETRYVCRRGVKGARGRTVAF